MGKAIPGDTSSIIVRALAQGHSRTDIAKMCGVSTRAVTRVSTNLKKHGSAKPPPSGLKQGRPAKLTRKQAEALLVWIAAHDYAFYVKDLTSYLKEHHNYRGCDGTVRRALLRSGFKRKEPYHKSEITVWIPPDHPPKFEVITEDDPLSPSGDAGSFDNPSSPTKITSVPNIAMQQTSTQAPEAPMTTQSQDATPTILDSYPTYDHQTQETFQGHLPAPPLDPSLYELQPIPELQQNIKSQHSGRTSVMLPSSPQASSGKTQAAKSPLKRQKKPRKEEQLESQVSTMQAAMDKQAELIRQLQAQLAQSHDQGHMQGLHFGSDGIDPALHGQNEHEADASMHDDEGAV